MAKISAEKLKEMAREIKDESNSSDTGVRKLGDKIKSGEVQKKKIGDSKAQPRKG